MADTTVLMAESWPMIRPFRRSAILSRRPASDSATLPAGMPVIFETTVAMSSAVTVLTVPLIRTMEPASSIASMALSGSDLSRM